MTTHQAQADRPRQVGNVNECALSLSTNPTRSLKGRASCPRLKSHSYVYHQAICVAAVVAGRPGLGGRRLTEMTRSPTRSLPSRSAAPPSVTLDTYTACRERERAVISPRQPVLSHTRRRLTVADTVRKANLFTPRVCTMSLSCARSLWSHLYIQSHNLCLAPFSRHAVDSNLMILLPDI